MQLHLLDQPHPQALLGDVGAAAESHVALPRRLAGPLVGGLDPVGDEVESGRSIALQRLAGMMVMTKTGTWKGGSSPHQPSQGCSSQGP